jgi:4-hydroxy-2-oxoglutarate aldolase
MFDGELRRVLDCPGLNFANPGYPMNLDGIYPALTTPFDANGAVQLDHLRENIARYNQTALAGYVVIGSTAESVFLSRAEMEQILATVRETAAPGRILIAGTGAESTAETISRTQAAANLGYDCALVKTPYYYKPALSAESYVEHYRRVADASPIPVLLYSVPQFTGVALEADLVARLAEHPNIIGMKDSSGNVQRVGEIINAVPEEFQVLVGSAGTLFPSMMLGAKGGVLALADFLPELCLALYEAITIKNISVARELQRMISPASKKIVGGMGIPGSKYAMDCRGFHGGSARPPLLPVTGKQKQEVESILAALQPAKAAR